MESTTGTRSVSAAARINGLDLFHFWLKRRLEVGSKLAYSDYSLQAILGEKESAPWPYGGTSRIAEAGSYAYHLDAAALGDYLREIATSEGVQHLFGNVQDVSLDERGNIATLDIGGGRAIAGDLFLDATGFRGRLIEQALGDPWIDWSKFMLCDSAVAMPLPRGDRFPPYTLSSAMTAGWTWRIPLSSRTGNGYVFSSAHISTDAAIEALIGQSGLREARGADPRLINFRVGRRTNFWAPQLCVDRACLGFCRAPGIDRHSSDSEERSCCSSIICPIAASMTPCGAPTMPGWPRFMTRCATSSCCTTSSRAARRAVLA